MIAYILETLLFQSLFILFYLVALRRMTFFSSNRVFLVGSLVVSLVLPLIELPVFRNSSLPALDMALVETNLIELEAIVLGPGSATSGFSWILAIWTGGAVMSLFWLLFRLSKLHGLSRGNRSESFEAMHIVRLPGSDQAFSFFHWIFLGELLDAAQEKRILEHELAHARQWHSLDVVLLEALRIPFWFNPILWIYHRLLDEVHEFAADATVVSGNPPEQYYRELLGQVFGVPSGILGHTFFKKSLIVKRIKMLQRKSTRKSNIITYLLVLPLLGAMLWVSACEQESEPAAISDVALTEGEKVADYKARMMEILNQNEDLTPEQRQAILDDLVAAIEKASGSSGDVEFPGENATASGNTKDNRAIVEVPFAVIDEVPVFPGCEDAADPKACFNKKMIEHVRKHFNYPEEAEAQGIQGRVAVIFTIGIDGGIEKIATRGPHPLLEEEVRRIIGRLPKMKPGIHEGGAVKVPFSLPIVFKLD
ncbi:TonB family C-terminal domain-containing protein [Robiginitalea myxolifaciens]|uniref:TonB family C-terminal domain-containing protein n=1 Tax=Robiginitalea myxolifaciens TaxID=400055 RepID=A0A1I6FUU9_9FLAO|nr:M56 family metallopeptidase [Robiginitalea myxolifaciens]SFR33710.1 TonB family C-terminal domain-containing protein [Robiginitalea myxolifaciens]